MRVVTWCFFVTFGDLAGSSFKVIRKLKNYKYIFIDRFYRLKKK